MAGRPALSGVGAWPRRRARHQRSGTGKVIGALDAADYIAAELEQKDRSILQVRSDLVEAINRRMWGDERQAYVDSIHSDGTLSPVSSQVTNVLMLLYGAAQDERRTRLLNDLVSEDTHLLKAGSSWGLFYILEVLDQTGEVEAIFRHICHRWGDMVRAGDKTARKHMRSSDMAVGQLAAAAIPSRLTRVNTL